MFSYLADIKLKSPVSDIRSSSLRTAWYPTLGKHYYSRPAKHQQRNENLLDIIHLEFLKQISEVNRVHNKHAGSPTLNTAEQKRPGRTKHKVLVRQTTPNDVMIGTNGDQTGAQDEVGLTGHDQHLWTELLETSCARGDTICTAHLLRPWAPQRLARHRADAT